MRTDNPRHLKTSTPLIRFILDFDGTIAPTDTVDALLERFASPEWLSIEQEWTAGRINSQQCMAAQIALVSASEKELRDFFDSVATDPHFARFIRYVKPFADIAIVSDGLDVPIHRALARRGISLPVFANELRFREGGLDLSFPHAAPECTVQSGVCKCSVAGLLNGSRVPFTVLIGDGRSDFCIARRAGYVFAKKRLREFCEANQIPFTPFESFSDVLSVIEAARDEAQTTMPEASCPFATRYSAQAALL